MTQKPSIRNIIATANEYLTLVESGHPFAEMNGVGENVAQLTAIMESYNNGAGAAGNTGPKQAAFEDAHAKRLMEIFTTTKKLLNDARVQPDMKKFVVDGGGSEWNRVNLEKIYNAISPMVNSENVGMGRAASVGHNWGSLKYPIGGSEGTLKEKTEFGHLKQVQSPQTKKPATGAPKL